MLLARKPKVDTGKIVDLINSSPQAIDLLTKVGVAFYGMKAINHPAGALIGLIGLKLSQADNIVSGLSGVTTLASIGLAQQVKTVDVALENNPLAAETYKQLIRKLLRLPPIG